MKRILYLSFYFEPDLCAGSFRNSPLAKELSRQGEGEAYVEIITTMPNRYNSFITEALDIEVYANYSVERISIPDHQSGMKDQILSFKEYYTKVMNIVRNKQYDIVFASSSRLFTAYLGYRIAKRQNIPLYLDIRDIFYDTIEDVVKNSFLKKIVLPIIKYIEKKTFGYATHINLISGGFKPYFESYNKANYSYYFNGVDEIFIENARRTFEATQQPEVKSIVYAGNVGEGQGLHKIIPLAAKQLGEEYKFLIIGDGGAKVNLEDELNKLGVTNVELRLPIERSELLQIYNGACFLFVHLNDYDAFKKVLPSKLFELATFPVPIIAGVGGYAAQFVKQNIENTLVFEPCNVDEFVRIIRCYEYKREVRTNFIEKFNREEVNKQMASSILSYI